MLTNLKKLIRKMAQPSIAAFFNTRKRAVAEDITTIKTRVSFCLILSKKYPLKGIELILT